MRGVFLILFKICLFLKKVYLIEHTPWCLQHDAGEGGGGGGGGSHV